MHAVVLAGGRGQRLAPFTLAFPKPLVPIGDIPIIEILLRQLRWYGVDRVTISVGYLRHLIETYFATRGPIPGLEIDWLREIEPLGTAGPVGQLRDCQEDLLVVNGDLLTTFDFGTFIEHHQREKPALTIATRTKEVPVDGGVLELDANTEVTGYAEKPRLQLPYAIGINLYSPRAIQLIKPGEIIDFPDLTRRAIAQGERVCAFRTDCYWTDVGRPADYEKAIDEFPDLRHLLLPDEASELVKADS